MEAMLTLNLPTLGIEMGVSLGTSIPLVPKEIHGKNSHNAASVGTKIKAET